MSKKSRTKKQRKADRKARQALVRVLGIAGSIAGVLALGATGVLARGKLEEASRDLGRSIEHGLARMKNAWPLLDRSNGVATSRGLS